MRSRFKCPRHEKYSSQRRRSDISQGRANVESSRTYARPIIHGLKGGDIINSCSVQILYFKCSESITPITFYICEYIGVFYLDRAFYLEISVLSKYDILKQLLSSTVTSFCF